MPKYRIAADVESASGVQYWTVVADNEAEAMKKHNEGKSDFEYEEIEVTNLDAPRVQETIED